MNSPDYETASEPPIYNQAIEFDVILATKTFNIKNNSDGHNYSLTLPIYESFWTRNVLVDPLKLSLNGAPVAFISGSPSRLSLNFITYTESLRPSYSDSEISYYNNRFSWKSIGSEWECRSRDTANTLLASLNITSKIPWTSLKSKNISRSEEKVAMIKIYQFDDLNSILANALSIAVFARQIANERFRQHQSERFKNLIHLMDGVVLWR
jgi:hypothetical protein